MKQILVGLGIIVLSLTSWWLIRPALVDDVVDEMPTVAIPEETVKNTRESANESEEEKLVQTEAALTEDTDLDTVARTPATTLGKMRLYSGTFQDGDASHTTDGRVFIQGTDLSLVDFRTTNVPDGFIYLANDLGASDHINLGALKGKVGNQYYVLPEDVDVSDYQYVLIWCRAFSTLIGSARIN